MLKTSLKIGLALGGGAFRGLAHIGVLQELGRAGVPIDYVAGTSMGAVVGGLYCSGADMALIERFCYTIEQKSLVDVTIPRQGLVSGKRIETLLRLLTGGRSFAEMKTPFACVAADIEHGEPVVLNQGPICEAIRASISIPGIFTPVKRDGQLLVDGGVISRVPIDVAKDMGADFVISVDVGYHGGAAECKDLSSILIQAFSVMEWQALKDKIVSSDYNISPDLLHINMASIDQAEETIEIGRQETLRCLPEIIERIHEKEASLLHGQPFEQEEKTFDELE